MSYASVVLLFANNAGTTLAGPITNTATSLNVASGGGALFPTPSTNQGFVITATDAATGLLREIMLCTARSTDTFTVVRAQEGTTALNWLAGDLIDNLCTAGQMGAMLQASQVFLLSTSFYVNFSSGNDSNPGTSALPFQTLEGAYNYISKYQSPSGVTITCAAGTLTIGTGLTAMGIGSTLIAKWNIVGAGSSSTIIDCTATGARGIVAFGSVVYVDGVSIGAYYECMVAQNGGTMTIASAAPVNITGSSHGNGIGSYYGAIVNIYGNVTVTGTYASAVFAAGPGTLVFGYHDVNLTYSVTITYSGVTVSGANIVASQSGYVNMYYGYVTFSGTPTGKKYAVSQSAGINGNGGGLALIPGSVAGTVDATTYGWTQA